MPVAQTQPWLPFKKQDGTVIRRYFSKKPSKAVAVNDNSGQTVGTKTFSSLEQLQQSVALPATYADKSVRLVTVAELLAQKEISNEQAWEIACMPMKQMRGADGRTAYVPGGMAAGFGIGAFTNANNGGIINNTGGIVASPSSAWNLGNGDIRQLNQLALTENGEERSFQTDNAVQREFDNDFDQRGFEEFAERTKDIIRNKTQAKQAFQQLLDRDFEGLAEHFDFSSPQGLAVFWSKNYEAAQEYANSIGGTTLEMTQGGSVMNNWNWLKGKYPTWADEQPTDLRPLWKAFSKKYAQGVTGIATYVHPKGEYGYMWEKVEYKTLKINMLAGIVDEIREVIVDSK